MDDYISREAAIERFCNVYCGCSPEECGFKISQDGVERCTAVRALKEVPAADVRPVVRGEWEIMSNPKYRRCSVCHDKVMFNMKNLPNFCDVCGADMRPEPTEEENNE